MNIPEFLKRYSFHDSCIDEVSFDEEKKELLFLIDFCFYMQDDYKEGDPDVGMVEVHFFDVEDFDGDIGKFDSFWIILRILDEGERLRFCLTGKEYREWTFSTSGAKMKVIG